MADNDLIGHSRLADDPIAHADKDQIADAMKILALNMGWYHQRYGDVPQEELLRMVRRETLGDDGKRLLLHGMQNLVIRTGGGDGGPGRRRGGGAALIGAERP